MACLIRIMKSGENSFTNRYVKNGKTYEDGFLKITSTNRHSTNVVIETDEDQIIALEVQNRGCLERQYDLSICLDKQTNRIFLDTFEVYLEIWHMPQTYLDLIAEYVNAPHSRIFG